MVEFLENDPVEEVKASKKMKGQEKGRDTLFRVAYCNQINLIQIADNKANIIISINTMIISSIIAITGYGMVAEKIAYDKTSFIIPITCIILSCLVSVVFAINAARPKLIKAKTTIDTSEKSSLLFFGVIAQYTQEQYLFQVNKMLSSEKDIYDSMTIDLYSQGIILKRKYTLLSYAYSIFMFGFIFSVLIFLGFFTFG